MVKRKGKEDSQQKRDLLLLLKVMIDRRLGSGRG